MATRRISGVDEDTMNKIQSQYQQSEESVKADNDTRSYLSKVQQSADNASKNGIVSQKYWDKIDTDYTMSQNVQNAMNYTDELLAQLSTGKTSYSDQVDEMIKSIMNREEFSYDPDKDTLFQNALSSAMKSGQSAMQDTIGQASALTGGYGSSYATSVGNQAYNAYIEDAYNNLPEYYNMALQTYQMDLENEYSKLGMLNNADDKEYNRLYNSYQANFQNWTQKYDMEYNQWRDSVNIALQAAGLELDESNSIFDRLSTAYSASNSFSDSLYEREYGQWRDSVSNAFNLASMENSDYWKQYSAAQSASKEAKEEESKKKKLTKEQLRAAEVKYKDPALQDMNQYEGYYDWLTEHGYDTTALDELEKEWKNQESATKEYESQKKEEEQKVSKENYDKAYDEMEKYVTGGERTPEEIKDKLTRMASRYQLSEEDVQELIDMYL